MCHKYIKERSGRVLDLNEIVSFLQERVVSWG